VFCVKEKTTWKTKHVKGPKGYSMNKGRHLSVVQTYPKASCFLGFRNSENQAYLVSKIFTISDESYSIRFCRGRLRPEV